MLASQTFGTNGGVPLLIAHGLFGSGRNWGVIAKRLAERQDVITVDMRNHGTSPWFESNSYLDMGDDLAEIAMHPADVLGHSMGGKAAMMLALRHPQAIRRLIVADIAPVAYGHSQQAMIDAMRGIDLSIVEKRSDADAQLAEAIPEAGVRAFLLQSLDVAGQRWRLNLDVLEKEMAGIVGWPDPPGAFDGPALFLSGGDSDYVTRAHRDIIKSLFPKARFARIPGAGHWLHADKPREFVAAVRAFLDA